MGMTSFDLHDDLEEEVEETLGYNDQKKDAYNEAVGWWVEVTPMLDELFDRYEKQEREEFVRVAVREKVEDVKKQNR